MANLTGNWSDAFDIVPEPVIAVTGGGEVLAANEAARALFPGLAEGRSLTEWLDDGEVQFGEVAAKLKRTTGTLPFAFKLKSGHEDASRLRFFGRRLRNDTGGLTFILRVPAEGRNSFAALSLKVEELDREVRMRRATQKAVEEALDGNRLLTRELYHRVNNNLQLQISLLRRAGREATDTQVKAFVERAIGRIRAMSVGLDLTYRRSTGAPVRMSDLLELLVRQLSEDQSAYGRIELASEFAFSIPDVQVTPLALIINEAVTNAFHHASDRDTHRIRLRCWTDGTALLLDIEERAMSPDSLFTERTASEIALIDILARQAAVSVERMAAPPPTLRLIFKSPLPAGESGVS